MSTQNTPATEGRRATPGAIAAEEGDRHEAALRTERLRESLDGDRERLKAAKENDTADVAALQTRVDEARLELEAAEAFEDAIGGGQ